MPVPTYSHLQNQETGEIVLTPDLTSKSIDLTKQEMEEWLAAGKIPEELHRPHLRDIQMTQDKMLKIKRGEPLESESTDLIADRHTEYLIKNKALLYEENVFIKIFETLADTDEDIVWLKFVKESISSILSKDPIKIHFYSARKILKEKFSIEDNKAVDILARELLEHCQEIFKTFKSLEHPVFQKHHVEPNDLDDHLSNKKVDILEIDFDFIKYLKQIGHTGKKNALLVQKNSQELFKFYKTQNFSALHRRSVWGLWIPPADDNELLSPFITLLCQTLWQDRCQKLWNRQLNQVAAVTTPIVEIIKPILNPKGKKSFIHQNETIICCDKEGIPILTTPVVDANMFAIFKNGIKNLSSLTGHKVVRWQIQTGFENWSENKKDPRLIEIDGGYSKISELCNCNSEHDIAKIRDILHAQAHGYFTFPDGSRGNMISLRVLEKYRNSEPSKINIILGDMLLPNYVFKLPNNNRRLIPIGDFPSFYGSKNTYANQAHLQLLVFEEFANQSDRLAKIGSILLSEEKWREMAYESGINLAKIQEIIHHWSQPDLVNWFLDRQGDEYRLTSYYKKVENFLLYQGEQRLINSERGKKSAAKRSARNSKNIESVR